MSGAGKETTTPTPRHDVGYTSGDWPSKDDVVFHDHNAHFGTLPASLAALASGLGPPLPTGTSVLDTIRWLDSLLSALENYTQRVYGFSLNSVLHVPRTGSFSLAAEIAVPRGFTLDSVLGKTMSGSAALDAIIQAQGSGSFLFDAITLAPRLGSFSLDAYVDYVAPRNLTLDAIILALQSGTLSLDAVLFLSRAASATLDSILRRVQSGSLALDAVLLKGRTGSMTLDAVIRASSFTFTLDAKIRKTVIYRPTSDVAKSGTTYSSGTAAWSLVDESTLNTADYFENKVANGYTFMGITPGTHPSSDIKSVTIEWRGSNSAPAFSFSLGFRNGTTNYDSSTYGGTTVAQNATTGSWTAPARPWDNAAWTTTDIDNLAFGVIAPSSLPKIRATQMWVSVVYY